jgi:cytochrome c556
MSKTLPAILFAILTLSACGGEPEDTRPGQPVAHRRAAFKTILRASEPIGIMLREGSYDAKRFQLLAAQLKNISGSPWDYFKADTLYPPSKARSEVWTQADKFAADKQVFLDAVDKLTTIGAADAKQAMAAYLAVENSCRDCHKAFKTK